MSLIDNFMSQVIDFNEKEKEETILFLATAVTCGNPTNFIRNISKKVTYTVMSFLSETMLKNLKDKGGEKVESIGIGKGSEKV